MTWTLEEIAKITNGAAVGQAPGVSRVTTDTRSVVPGDLFVALRGEHFDGHDFLASAMAGGAAAVVVDGPAAVEPRIEVPDTLLALRLLAADRRRALAGARAVGITGSTGKTSCKDLLASALGVGTWASPKSFNNEIGVPLTVLSAPVGTDVLVLEVGSRGLGHIRDLIDVVLPDVAVITSIGASHLATLGDVDTVRLAKWELVEGLGPDGVAVLPASEAKLIEWAARDGVVLRTFGANGDVRIENLQLDDLARPSFTLEADGERAALTLSSMAGAHQAHNAAAAAAAALSLGRALPDVAAGLELATASAWRMEITPGRYTVVNDAYNANPASMAAALHAVAAIPGRHVAVLGLMAELGDTAPTAHREIGLLARELGFAALVIVGEDPGIAAGAGDIARPVPDAATAGTVVTELLDDGDVVLVKASRSVGLEALAAGARLMIALLVAVTLSFGLAFVAMPVVIRALRRHDVGQFIQEDVAEHSHKRGTPTMGGTVIIVATIFGYASAHLRVWSPSAGFGLDPRPASPEALLALFALVGMGIIGFIDDYQKYARKQNLGLSKRWKFGGQLLVAGLFAWGAVLAEVSTELSFTRELGFDLGWAYPLWVLFLLTAAANAVNLTDGLDGLAAGSSALVFGSFVIIGFWQFRNPSVYPVDGALDIGILAAALLGAVMAFLWYNAALGELFMGDVGSQALGGAMAALALLTNTHLLLAVIGGLYVIEAMSVILQVASFRLFGNRIFRMAPIHHHFELRGWPETTVIIRFWIIAGISVALGLGIFYGDFISMEGGLS